MLKNRGRDPRSAVPNTPTMSVRSFAPRAPMAKPEPDYEVVEFPSEQYVNAKLQPPPPSPPRPPTGHPQDAGASCGLCGGGGARVRCTECGRRALCASCDDMYHRHPKRRHHQRLALSSAQLRDERPPLPPKAAPPVPPPRRHKMSGDRSSASPLPPAVDQRRATLSMPMGGQSQLNHMAAITNTNHFATQRPQIQHPQPASTMTQHMGSMPYLPNTIHHSNAPVPSQDHSNTLGHFSPWGRPRGSLQGFNLPPNMVSQQALEPWDAHDNISTQSWGRPLRRGTSVMELGGGPTCSGCAHCSSNPWRYGSCANLEHQWFGPGAGPWPQGYCGPHPASHDPRLMSHPHVHPSQTPQPYRRAESRAVSRVASRAGSRAPSPAMSMRSRASRRSKHRTPSPPLPSSDADSESEIESDHADEIKDKEDSLGPPPPPPSASWQCEHCTFVNEPGVRVCVVCCRTPTVKPKIVTDAINHDVGRLKVAKKSSRSPSVPVTKALEQTRIKNDDRNNKAKSSKERTSTPCGPSPPREERKPVLKAITRLATPPNREQSHERTEPQQIRHDIAVGPSPPRELQDIQNNSASRNSLSVRSSTHEVKNIRLSPKPVSPLRESKIVHSVSVGPSPPRDSPMRTTILNNNSNFQKKSVGSSPPRETLDTRPSSRSSRTNTGTSPPPQSISTQTYEVPSNWERTQSASRSRPRRRVRDEDRRERSHSRVSLSSDTRESERSIHTSGGRWEWKEPRDSSPSGEWSESERRRTSRLTRRASHLDLRRRPVRRSSMYGSEAPSPEPLSSNRAISLEALAGAGSRREAERGLELARLMTDAERLGFSAAEVHAALAQNPVAPLAWLSERWPSLCAGVRAAAARLAPGVNVTELEARAALARHRGAMWPAVNECVERSRRQAEVLGEEGRLRGHVWGPPTGVDDDAAPPSAVSGRSHRIRADDSSDEFEVSTNRFQDDDWMYLPLDLNTMHIKESERPVAMEDSDKIASNNTDLVEKLKELLTQAGIPLIDEKLLLKGLSKKQLTNLDEKSIPGGNKIQENKLNVADFIQSENDFIDAYNALTRLSPLPSLNKNNHSEINSTAAEVKLEQNQNITMNTASSNQLANNEQIEITTEVKTSVPTVKNVEELPEESMSGAIGEIFHNDGIDSHNIQESIRNNINLDNMNLKEDKPNNLSDIVDNTQKLIQQMKKEINSDIKFMHDKSDTQSEPGGSSNGSHSSSEKESSYSDTEEQESDDLTSDEKEVSSSEEESNDHSGNRLSIQRTSSEDNENFEEAMDHVENELENFKDTNIEILNSIAQSLQEEHSITIELNNNQELRKSDIKNQDMNNNLFAEVDTFEEIYAQLDNDGNIGKRQHPLTNQSNTNKIENLTNDQSSSNIPTNNSSYNKENIIIRHFKENSPIKLVVHEYVNKVSTAIIENLEETLHETDFEVIRNNMIGEEHKVSLENLIALAENNKTINIQMIDENRTTGSQNKEILNENTTSVPSLLSNNIANVEKKNEENIKEDELNTEHNQVEKLSEISTISSNNDIVGSTSNTEDIVTISDNNINSTDLENANSKTISKIKNLSSVNKSNIPKLIKTIQSNKQKIEHKNLPKAIASKVPIRRGSLKQYPAPSPPKTHFGNVQSGHVKQLQTKLFNDKEVKVNIQTPPVPEAKASTSTIIKKKPAPPPPINNMKEMSPVNPASLKKKNEYFRETCRTEDEWTESDTEEQNIQSITDKEEFIPMTPSTPQPVTVRQVAGQLIDLARVRLPEGSPERQARMLLAEGVTETWDQAQLAVELISQGTDPPAALLAALECNDLRSALVYLHQDCELCASKFPEHEIVSMLRCTHRCCRECASHYFMVQITERSIVDCVCPYCKEPELENLPEDDWLDYFAHMDILLKTLLETDIHELFQRKLRDRTLARDPNFRWCVECSSGFFVHPKQKKLRCPECKSVTCANCRKPWNANHDGLTCDQYTAWLEDNDPERSIVAVQQHLKENGLDCPRCHFKYSLSRGGCMHFTCTQCKYEFCYGCGKPFMMGARCGLSEYCAKLGLHAHHPRNCLFYLRDKEPHELQTLLQMNNVTYETEAQEGSNNRCPIQLQKETPTGLIDTTCGNEVQPKQAGLCKMHYVEYLAGLARALDPIPIMEVSELVAELRRRALPLPERGPWDTDPIYAGMCAEIVREKIPLD